MLAAATAPRSSPAARRHARTRLGILAAWAAGQLPAILTDVTRTAGLVMVGLLGLLARAGVVFAVVALAPQRQQRWHQRERAAPGKADEPTR